MQMTLNFLMVGAFSSMLLLAGGCGQEEDLDLSTLPLVSEDKTDTVPGLRPLAWTRPSLFDVQCIRAPCSTHMIYDVNTGHSELAYAYDWRALRLSKAQEEQAEKDAGSMLLYGRYATAKAFGESVLVYQVSRANLRVAAQASDSPVSDRYYSTSAASCPQTPCTSLRAQLLNQTAAPTEWAGVDLRRLELSKAAAAQLENELRAGKAYISVETAPQRLETAQVRQAFRPLLAPPLN